MDLNPYRSPARSGSISTRTGTEIFPPEFAETTRKIVCRFGWFQFLSQFAMAFWTDRLLIDVIAIFIAVTGMHIDKRSFETFPWTALVCLAYPLTFAAALITTDVYAVENWIPSRFSPVLSLQLVAAAWSLLVIYSIMKCYFSRRAPEGDH